MSSDVGCVLLTGNGPSPKDGGWAFCSGGDQRIRGRSGYPYAEGETADTVDDRRVRAEGGRLHILEVQRLIRFMPKVVIALVNGWAAGGGHSLHVVCDLTIASAEHAKFKQTDADDCRTRHRRKKAARCPYPNNFASQQPKPATEPHTTKISASLALFQ
jgi:naphthoate synthase